MKPLLDLISFSYFVVAFLYPSVALQISPTLHYQIDQ